MERESVSSSMINSIGYNSDESTLEIEFSNESVYEYYDVSEDIFNDLRNADSSGVFFNTNIRGKYSESKI